jgi:CheY-like chemotaxis protein
MMKSQRVVLDIGQCSADHSSIRRLCEGLGARVERAHTGAEALSRIAAGGVDLVLVNRILDADGADGVALISELVEQAPQPLSIMLVSNYPQFQQEAVRRGAVPGFGKAELHSAETRELLMRFL